MELQQKKFEDMPLGRLGTIFWGDLGQCPRLILESFLVRPTGFDIVILNCDVSFSDFALRFCTVKLRCGRQRNL